MESPAVASHPLRLRRRWPSSLKAQISGGKAAFFVNALSRLRQSYGGPRDNLFDVRYKSLALSPFTTLRHSAISRLHAS